VSLLKSLNASWGQAVYPSWWPGLTKEYKQDRSVLELYDRHKAEWFIQDK